LILTVLVEFDQLAQAGIKGTPRTFVRRRVGHGHQEFEFLAGPGSAPGDAGILMPGKALCLADQMGKAGLVQVDPFPVGPVIVTDQDALPGVDELLEGLLGPPGMDHEETGRSVAHDPEPVQLAPGLIPGCLIHMIDRSLVNALPDGLIVWQYGPGGPVDDLLHRPDGDVQAENLAAEALDRFPAVPMVAA